MEKLSTSQLSPLSPTRWPDNAFSAKRCLIFLAAIAVAFGLGFGSALIAVTLGGPAVTLGGPAAIRSGKSLQLTSRLLIAQIILYIPLLGAALSLLPFTARRTLREIGLHAPTPGDVGAGVLGAVAMYLAANGAALLQKFTLHIEGTEQVVALFGSTHDRTLICGLVILAVFIAPFVEEVIFRGFVFNALLRHVPVGVATVVSGIIFGLAHFDINDLAAIFPLACSGCVLAIVYYRTGSLVSSMVTHGTFNAANVALILLVGGNV